MHNRLRTVRKSLCLNQTDFAKQIGLNQNSLSMIEKGKTPVTEKNIKLVCVTFNINEQWFRTGIGEMFYASPYERELRDICSQLTPETQQSLLVIVRELLNVQQKLLKASQSEDTPCG